MDDAALEGYGCGPERESLAPAWRIFASVYA